MAWTGSSYNLWLDDALTLPFSGTLQVVNKTDLSDNPQDFVLYLGSPTSGRILQDRDAPGVDDITLTPTDALAEWEATTSYLVGDRVQPVGGNGKVYRCTSAGISAGTAPTWPTTGIGSTVVDGTCIWALLSIKHEPTEVILALTEGDLDTNTAGAALAIGNTVNSLAANAVEIHIRVVNAVTNVANNTGNPEITLVRSAVIETASP